MTKNWGWAWCCHKRTCVTLENNHAENNHVPFGNFCGTSIEINGMVHVFTQAMEKIRYLKRVGCY